MPEQPQLKTLRILWAAMLMSIVIYAGLCFSGIFPPRKWPPEQFLLFVLPAVSIAAALVSFLLPKITYQAAITQGASDVARVEEPAPEGFSGQYREAMPKRMVFADPAQAAQKAFVAYQAPFILSLALSEVSGICGLVLANLGFGPTVPALLLACSFGLIAVRFPRQPQILEQFEKALGASFPSKS